MKLCLAVSPGGHLYQAHLLKDWWQDLDRFWVTISSPDADFLLKNEKKYYAHGPENRSLINLARNLLIAIKVLLKEKPDIIFSTGAGIAPPFFWVAWLLKIKTIYLEPYDFINKFSMTAKLVAPFASVFLVQHQSLIKQNKKAKFWGTIL